MKFFFFHLMPYADIDLSYIEKHRTSHVKLPNRLYDPEKGAALYERYINEHVYASEMGFEAVCVNEHHQTAYGMMPAPNVMAGALSQRLRPETKIAVLGRALPLVSNPLSIAEEYAMIDNMTRGRLIAGFVRGIGTEYHATATNPTDSHARFREGLNLIIDAWTKPGPFAHEGKFFNNPYVNVWPRPYQQEPHPPIFLPSTGSSETVLFAAEKERKYTYMQTSAPAPTIIKYMQMYHEAAQREGYQADPNKIGWSPQIYVAETDEIAVREARPHIEALANYFMIITPELFLPPGYTSRESMKQILKAKAGVMRKRTIEEMIASDTFICGSPQTVIDKITDLQRRGGFNLLTGDFQFGTLPAELTRKNTEIFAREVMPVLKDVTPNSYKSQAA